MTIALWIIFATSTALNLASMWMRRDQARDLRNAIAERDRWHAAAMQLEVVAKRRAPRFTSPEVGQA